MVLAMTTSKGLCILGKSVQLWTNKQYDGTPTGTRKRSIRTGPNQIFIGQCETTLVHGPETDVRDSGGGESS